jgi:ABC1 atypical kinase-like domain
MSAQTNRRVLRLVNEHSEWLWLQGRSAARFRRNFAGTPWVRVPCIEWALSSPMVLTLEYLPGLKISDVPALRAAGLDTSAVARRATEAYLTQILCAPTGACRITSRRSSRMLHAAAPSLQQHEHMRRAFSSVCTCDAQQERSRAAEVLVLWMSSGCAVATGGATRSCSLRLEAAG